MAAVHMRTTLWILLGCIVGLALSAAGVFFFMRSEAGISFLRDYIVEASKTPTSETPYIPPVQTNSSATSTPQAPKVVLVPKKYATEQYFFAINNVVADILAMDEVNRELGPVLGELNAKTLSCTFGGIYDLMTQARTLAQKNQTLAAQFSLHMNDLSAANTQTSDALTKSLTGKALVSGQAFGTSLQTYAAAVQSLLSGDVPNAQTLAAFDAQARSTKAAGETFNADFLPLLGRFKNTPSN